MLLQAATSTSRGNSKPQTTTCGTERPGMAGRAEARPMDVFIDRAGAWSYAVRTRCGSYLGARSRQCVS